MSRGRKKGDHNRPERVAPQPGWLPQHMTFAPKADAYIGAQAQILEHSGTFLEIPDASVLLQPVVAIF